MLKIGDHIVYGIHGLCRVEDILVPSFLERGKEKDYYLLIAEGDEKGLLYVPVDSEAERLRSVADSKLAEQLIQASGTLQGMDICGGKKSEPLVAAVIKRNDPPEMMGLIRTLYLLRSQREGEGKKFAAVDEKHLATAEKLLFTELAHALGCTAEDIRARVQEGVRR